MRARLLANPGALADYEILEMLLFLGIPRRDTKPQAKGLLLQLGTLLAVLTAEGATLTSSGFPARVADIFQLVVDSAALLAGSERTQRVLLADWQALDRYLDPSQRSAPAAGLAALLLNNRNQLLAECSLPLEAPSQALARHALDRHATAVILLRDGGAAEPTQADHRLLAEVRTSMRSLSLLVHDMVVVTATGWVSVEQDLPCSAG